MEADLAEEESPAAIPMFNILLGERSRAPRDPEAFADRQFELAEDPGEGPRAHEVPGATGHWPSPGSRADRSRRRAEEAAARRIRALAAGLCPLPRGICLFCAPSGGLNSVQTTLDIQGLESDTQIEHVGSLVRVAGLDSIIKPFENGSILMFSGGETPDQAAYWSALARCGCSKNPRHEGICGPAQCGLRSHQPADHRGTCPRHR